MPKSQQEINKNLLIAVYQNLQTSLQSINNVLEKVKDSKLKKELREEFRDYDELETSCLELAKVEGIELKDNGFFKKAKMWLSVNMATMMDKTNRKIASINIIGSTMGVIDLISVISDSKTAKDNLLAFAKRVLELEESNIEKLKPFILVENNKPLSSIANQGVRNGVLEQNETQNNENIDENLGANSEEKTSGDDENVLSQQTSSRNSDNKVRDDNSNNSDSDNKNNINSGSKTGNDNEYHAENIAPNEKHKRMLRRNKNNKK